MNKLIQNQYTYPMASVCRNPNIKSFYLDQIDERNQIEKAQFRDIFTEYMDLMNDNGQLQQQNAVMEKEVHQLR
jgi:hypothetical protein